MNRNLIVAALSENSRAELSATAKQLGLPVGKSKNNTVANIADAIAGVKGARCTIRFTIRKGNSSAESAHVVLDKKFRSARAGDTFTNPVQATAVA